MGDFLSTPNKTKVSSESENSRLKYGATGMQGWRKRMEDAHITDISVGKSNSLDVFGVFDGHGGKEVSMFVRNHFTEELLKNKSYLAGNLKIALIETFLRMDSLLIENEAKIELKKYAKLSKEEDEQQQDNSNQQNQLHSLQKMFDPKQSDDCDIAMMTGCTACVCVIDHNTKKIYFVNAGDSRVVLCKNKIAYPMSIDHKPDLEIEKNRIYKADGWVKEGRIKGNLNLSRSLGDLEYKQNKSLKPEEQMITAYPDVIEESLTSDCDFIILGCDGIWDCLSNQEACDYVMQKMDTGSSLPKILEDMMDSILPDDLYNETGVGCDNMTCIVVQFKKN